MTEIAPRTASLPEPGTVIDGRYRIDALHAEGGMSIVFRATHLLLERRVAFKVVSESVMGVPGCSERFLREARAATRLKNDHIVQVYDVGVLESGAPYMVMEWLEGGDLAQTLEAGPLPLETAIEYVLQVCETLAEVHGRGIIHRDLKPSNLFVTTGPDGAPRIKLLDFGVSKIASVGSEVRITQTGTILGSPSYMSPEQMGTAEEADERTDVWGVGIVLYELLVGDVPFAGGSLATILDTIAMQQPPKVSAVRADVPSGVDDVIARCLRSNPAERYPDVASLAADLAPWGPAGSKLRAVGIVALSHAARSRAPEIPAPVSAVNPTPPPAPHDVAPNSTPDETIGPCVQSNANPALEEPDAPTQKMPTPRRSALPFLSAALVLVVLGVGAGVGVSRLGRGGNAAPAPEPEALVSAPHVSLASAVMSAAPTATTATAVAPPPVNATAAAAPAPTVAAAAPITRVDPLPVRRWADLEPLTPTVTPPAPPTATPSAAARRPDELFEERK